MANRRQFLRTLAGAAALSITADVSSFGNTRRLRMSAAMPGADAHDRLQPDWYRRKIQQVQQEMKKRKLNALLLLNATNVIYTTGYFHLPTERPLAALAIAPLVKNSGAVIDMVAAQLRAAQAAGDTPVALDPDLEAFSLAAMSAGLATSVLAGQSSIEQAQAVIDYHLNRLFPPSRPAVITRT